MSGSRAGPNGETSEPRIAASAAGDCCGFRMVCASRRLAAHYDEALKPLGVTIGQFNMIRVIGHRQRVSHTQLAADLDLDRSTIGRKTRVLSRAGYVESSEGSDRREALLVLSGKGRALLAAGLPVWSSVEKEVRSRIGSHRLVQLDDLLSLF